MRSAEKSRTAKTRLAAASLGACLLLGCAVAFLPAWSQVCLLSTFYQSILISNQSHNQIELK